MVWDTEADQLSAPLSSSGTSNPPLSRACNRCSPLHMPQFYDPRNWLRKAEETMCARVKKACEDLGNVNTLALDA
jgi:fructose/tagatose bisphosphate aldolase